MEQSGTVEQQWNRVEQWNSSGTVTRPLFTQGVLQLDRRIRNLAVGHRGVVLGHADVVDLLAAAAALTSPVHSSEAATNHTSG